MNLQHHLKQYWMCLLLVAFGAIQTGLYLALGLPDLTAVILLWAVYAALILTGILAVQSNLPLIFLAQAVACGVLTNTTNFRGLVLENAWYLADTLVCGAAFLWAGWRWLRKDRSIKMPHKPVIALLLAVALIWGGVWQIQSMLAGRSETFSPQRWAVPEQYLQPCEQAGTVQALVYATSAYATDGRSVEKTAYVYVPYGYDESRQYNILYLMHGTGDSERHWLLVNEENKNMLDQLIARGEIEPMIVVTPTFYVEDDCTESQKSLDQLTRTFGQEIRNDLMPAVEAVYSTYAESLDEEGFHASRDHRAFAGLSRGAYTTCYSGFADNLEYFSWFGAFSGSRMEEDFFQRLSSQDTQANPVHYFYMSTGNFDFLLPEQIKNYHRLLNECDALTYGENTRFEVFPMRYHSWGNWNLALYNFLQYLFV